MKLTFALAALVAAAASVEATESNAQRMARGLNPLPPRNLQHPSRTSNARRHSPSGTPSSGNCNTGPVQCCEDVTSADHSVVSVILGLLGIVVDPKTLVGLKCSPLSVVGVGSGNSCRQRPVCCENNSKGGLISIGCIPIML